MSKSYNSIFEAITNINFVDSHVRAIAGSRVKQFFIELLKKHNIEDISEEDVEELAYDLIDDLCMETYTNQFN